MIRCGIILFTLLLSSILFAGEIDCSKYREGFFEYDGKHDGIIVYRSGDFQIEYNIHTDKWLTVKLNWISDCKYDFTYHKTNRPSFQQTIGSSMNVNIIAGDDEGYDYTGYYKRQDRTYTGRLIFLKTELSKKVKNKIIKQLKKSSK